MAKSTPVKKAWRSLTWLGVLVVVLLGILTAGVAVLQRDLAAQARPRPRGRHPDHPRAAGARTVSRCSSEQLDQAVSIIRQRIDASGVSEAQITTEGSRNIVVSLPGQAGPGDARPRQVERAPRLPPGARRRRSDQRGRRSATASPLRRRRPAPGLQSTPSTKPTNGSDLAWVTPQLQAEFDAYDCGEREQDVELGSDRQAAHHL